MSELILFCSRAEPRASTSTPQQLSSPAPSAPDSNALWIEFRLAFERVHATSRVYEHIANLAPEPAIECVRQLLRQLDAELADARCRLELAWRGPVR